MTATIATLASAPPAFLERFFTGVELEPDEADPVHATPETPA